MSPLRLARCLAAVTLLLALVALPLLGQPGGQKYAFIVGVNAYDHDRLPKLQYAVNDATVLAQVLRRAGYQVTLLVDSATPDLQPTKVNIEKHLHRVMSGFRKGDTVMIALAGHGLQFADDKDAYFCPSDAKPFKTRTDSLVSLKKIYQELEESVSGAKVLLVDACRDDPDASRRSRGVDADSAPPPPRGVAALFSCSAGQRALENPDLKHGVFFYHVLKGLEGAAKNQAGEVTYNGLAEHVMRRVPATVKQLTRGEGEQEPNQKADLRGIPVLVAGLGSVAPSTTAQLNNSAPNTTAELKKDLTIDLGNNIKLELVLVPAGEFLMGSPEGEADRLDNEKQHKVTLTQSFYMGKYEVTQEQYQQIMGKNPSWFSAGGVGAEAVKTENTKRFPVELVSWDKAVEFCRLLSAREQEIAEKRVYTLPTEAQWEYACRGGPVSSTSPFHFKNPTNSLSRGQANFNGEFPYNGGDKGENLDRTCTVGSYQPNRLGLYDMHGNVLEWCADWYDKDSHNNGPRKDPTGPATGTHRVLRGGSWCSGGRNCRSAYRNLYGPPTRGDGGFFGFRVVARRAP